MVGLLLLLAGLTAGLLIIRQIRRNGEMHYIFSLLQTCLSDCVRHMENSTRDMPGALGKKRLTIVDDYVSKLPAEAWQPPMPLLSNGALLPKTPDLPGLALEMIRMNEGTASSHWFKVNGIRTGMQAVLLLLADKNPDGARMMLLQLMQRQRDEFNTKGTTSTDPFTHLKIVLDLPIVWPTDDLPERLMKQRLSWERRHLILTTIRKYETLLFDNLTHKQWPTKDGEDRVIFHGREVLRAMEDYVR